MTRAAAKFPAQVEIQRQRRPPNEQAHAHPERSNWISKGEHNCTYAWENVTKVYVAPGKRAMLRQHPISPKSV